MPLVRVPPWAFRTQTTALADRLVGASRGDAGEENTAWRVIHLLARGALMHKDAYREAAQAPSMNRSATWVAATIIAAAALGSIGVGGLFSLALFGALAKAAASLAAQWLGALLLVQAAASARNHVELPLDAWFRGLILAQAPLALSFLPASPGALTLWVIVCTLAAIRDLSGATSKDANILLASAVAGALLGRYAALALSS